MNLISRLVALTACVFLTLACRADAMKEKATGISFVDKLNGLNIFGVGVRTKGPIKIYSVGCYGPKGVSKSLKELSASDDKKKAIETLQSGASKGPTTFLLKFNFKVNAEKVSSSITDAVASRFSGSMDVGKLKTLLCDGVGVRGSTVKGTTMQFDCSSGGVKVALDGKHLGTVSSGGLAMAFCNVYLDDKTVSPSLRQSCLENCCKP
jgi:hypothetical protein